MTAERKPIFYAIPYTNAGNLYTIMYISPPNMKITQMSTAKCLLIIFIDD